MSRRPIYYHQKTSLKSRLATINKTYVEDWEQPLHFAVHWYALSKVFGNYYTKTA